MKQLSDGAKVVGHLMARGSPGVKGAGSSLPSSLAKTGQCHIIGIMVGEELTEPEIAPPG